MLLYLLLLLLLLPITPTAQLQEQSCFQLHNSLFLFSRQVPLNVVLSYYYLAALYVTIGLLIVNEPICKIFGDILPFEEKKAGF